MSANNQLIIKRKLDKYYIYNVYVDPGLGVKVDQANDLECAIKQANSYMKKNIVEYGLKIELD